jgi:hypothetical protein
MNDDAGTRNVKDLKGAQQKCTRWKTTGKEVLNRRRLIPSYETSVWLLDLQV